MSTYIGFLLSCMNCTFNKVPRSIVDDMYLVNVTNVVQYNIILHIIIRTKCLKLRFDKPTCHNFFKLLVSIQTLM